MATAENVLHAQTREQTANLFADVELMKQELGQLRLQVERVLKENENLRNSMTQLVENQAGMRKEYLALVAQAETNIDAMRVQLEKGNLKNRKEIIAAVTAQVEKFAKQTQVAKAAAPKKKASSEIKYEFSDNFPGSGIEYTIKRGDNLWKIANNNSSKIQWIQDANRISNPGNLKVGSVIFLPQL